MNHDGVRHGLRVFIGPATSTGSSRSQSSPASHRRRLRPAALDPGRRHQLDGGGDSKGKTGTYFGLWALATKLATAIGAAGSLPVRGAAGLQPGQGLYGTTALIIAYIVLP